MKTCSMCNQDLPTESFSKKASARDGLQSRCRPCQKTYYQSWRAQNKDRLAAKRQKRQEIKRKKLATRQYRNQIKAQFV